MTFQLAHLTAKVKPHLGAHQVTPASSQVNELSRIEQEPQPLADFERCIIIHVPECAT